MSTQNNEEGQTKKGTVEISDAPEPVTSKPVLSSSELAEGGFSKEEITMAEKQGLVKKEGDSDEGDRTEKKGDPESGQTKEGQESKSTETKSQERRNEGRVLIDGKTPEQILADVNVELSSEQETVLKGVLNANAWGLYRAQKRERQKRQTLEAEKEALAKQKDAEIAELRQKLEAAQRKKSEAINSDDPLNVEEKTDPVDETDPKKKPLTEEDLERIEQEKQEKADKAAKAREQRAIEIKDALDDQQEEARERYKDFDDVLISTSKILEAANNGKLNELFPDPRERSKINREVMLLLNAYANADKIEHGDYNAADMTYELGKKYPAKPANANGSSKRGETDADGNPEKVERALQNANRRGSSASLTGGGSRRAVNLEELTEEQAGRIPTKDFNKLPKETRDRLLGKS